MSKLNTCVLAAVLAGTALSLSAQNMTLIRNWNRAGQFTNDVWGWTSPDGREFAFVGEQSAIWIVETTNGVLTQRALYSAPSSTWRDFTNVGKYIYVATENRTQRGFRVIDMSNPSAPRDIGYVQTTTMISAHNVSADPDAGFIYFSGSNQGVAIYDVKQDPTNPTLVGTWGGSYTHDICVRRGRGYFSLGRAFQVRIFDVTNPANLLTIGNAATPGGYAHNSWVSEDDQVLCCTDEISRGSVTPHMTVFDISNPANPVKKGDYDLGSNFIAHNVFVLGRTAYMSHYIDGCHVIDITNLSSPQMVARYDTSQSPSGYNGCWGCYPFSDSGLIYASDMQNGLFVLQADCGHMNRYGDGTAGPSGTPRIRFDGATPRVNAQTLRLECERLEPGKACWIALSSAQGTGTVLGANVHVNLASGQVVGPFFADAKGKLSIKASVPNDGNLANVRIYMQLFSDAGNGKLSASRGHWAGICK